MIAAVLCAAAARAADPDLAIYRAEAARINGDAEGAFQAAGQALLLAPESWQAHAAWQDALASSPWWLEAEYGALAASADPELRLLAAWWAAQGGAPFEPPPDAEPRLVAEVSARFSLDRGDPEAALSALGELNTPEASKLRMEALFELDEDGALRREAKAAAGRWPGRPDLMVWLVRDDSLLSKPERSRAISAAAALSASSDPLAVYRAHELLVAAAQPSLAEAAAARLSALGEPWPLPSRALWKPTMIRDLGRVLSLQAKPELPPGGVPDESQRVLVATAATLEAKGRPERAAEIWRMALAIDEADAITTLRAARALREAGAPPDEVLRLVREARTLASMGLDPGQAGAAERRVIVESWAMEAELLRGMGEGRGAVVAATMAVELGAGPEALVLLGQLLEAEGQEQAAIVAYARAAGAGHPDAGPALARLHPGPFDPAALVAAVGTLGPAEVSFEPPPKAPAFPATELRTAVGPVVVGGEQIVVVAFWASWCGPCREELPELDKLAAHLRESGAPVVFVAVSVDDTDAAMARWLREHPLPNLLIARDPALGRQLGLEGIPSTFVVGPGGEIITRHQGYAKGDIERLEAELASALDEHP